MAVDRRVEADEPLVQYWLYRCDDRVPFAYARGHDFIHVGDHTSWALLRDDWLISVRSGEALAYRTGRVFCDRDSHLPVYYVPASLPLPAESGGDIPAVSAMSAIAAHDRLG